MVIMNLRDCFISLICLLVPENGDVVFGVVK